MKITERNANLHFLHFCTRDSLLKHFEVSLMDEDSSFTITNAIDKEQMCLVEIHIIHN